MKMLRSVLLLTILPVLLSFAVQSPGENEFYVKGKIEGIKDGVALHLIQYSTGDTVATATSRNGKFDFRGSVPHGTEYYFIRIDTAISDRRSSELLLVNDRLTLMGKFSDWPKVDLKGSEPYYDWVELAKLWEATKSLKDQKEIIRKFIDEHSNSLYISDLIRRTGNLFSLDEREHLYAQLTSFAKDSYFGELLKTDLVLSRKRELIKEGTIIPDFSVTLPDGKKANCHELISQSEYTLIDFWASWCRPCREAVPGMKKVYQAFNERGFNILSIAISDKETNWQRALKEDATPWTNARDVEGICNDIFDIPAIPGFVLVDRKGKLISYHCSGSAIKNFGSSLNGDTLFTTIENLFTKTPVSFSTLKPIAIGEKVPDIPLGELASDPAIIKRLSDYKGKLLILDFWSTLCAVCIAEFPKIDKLQLQFADKVVILPVGFDVDRQLSIRDFLEKSKGTKRELKLPSVVQKPTDSLLMQLFPFWGLPHEVWIDPEGTLIGLTDHKALTAENIESILSGKVPSFSVRKPKSIVLSQSIPFLINRNAGTSLIYGSAFSGYIDSLTSISPGGIYRKDSIIRYYDVNQTMLGFYRSVYNKAIPEISFDWGKKRIIYEPSGKPLLKDWEDSDSMDNWAYEEFERNNLFAYEAILPSAYSNDQVYRFLTYDFDRFFKVKSTVEKRNTKYYALVRISTTGKIKSTIEDNVFRRDSDSLILRGRSIDELASYLNSALPDDHEIIDETKYKGKIRIGLNIRDQTIASMRKQLREYGLDLVEKNKVLNMLVFREENYIR
ncbi:MAG: AhpC/TSA family protein [Chitinophagales bacterium]|nr:AhpC/TSA family protein [Chitinophagales bacterium]